MTIAAEATKIIETTITPEAPEIPETVAKDAAVIVGFEFGDDYTALFTGPTIAANPVQTADKNMSPFMGPVVSIVK
jgi:hypothetical protein